jgi:hypothetical protein
LDGAVISFKYVDGFFNALVKHRTVSFSDYLASIGGLVGLIAGISVISLIDIFYNLIVFCFNFRPSKRLFRRVRPTMADESATENVLNEDHVIYQCSKYFFEFIRQSSVHGLIYTTKKDEHVVGRIFWIVFVFVSALSCTFLIRGKFRA